ncbi:IgGFc-binding protein-like [Ostrea edulis]|uniref:IgGFc-binding protein-like n=1 Tax=Ostrea edulis TaxID=37623 RepID=UPI0024AFE0E0|nr:IgGFc-binding protein-like [Ostrea edulis]
MDGSGDASVLRVGQADVAKFLCRNTYVKTENSVRTAGPPCFLGDSDDPADVFVRTVGLADVVVGRSHDNSEVIDKQNDENRDFISVILSDHQMQYTPSYIFMTTHTSTNVNITTSEALPEDHITKFNSSVTIPYTDFGTNGSSDVKAIRISSTENITAALGVQDITTLITTEKLGTSYILPNPYKDPRFEAYAAITVTAIHDNTTITISDWGETTFPDYTLNALETHVQEHHGSLPKTYSIQSSKPVAVFSGMYCMSDANCSNIIEQIPPFNQLDTVYIIPPNYNRFLTYILYLSKDNTTITSMNNDTIPITGGKRYDYIMLNEVVMVIRSADPILMTSYAVQYLPLGEHNPYWTVVPGVNQYLPRYKTVIQSGWNNNYIAIMIRKSAVGGMRLNKQSIDANTIRFEKNVFVEDLEYSVIIAEVAEGELTLDTIDGTPFGLMVYGSGEHGGYGFAGNVILR